MSTLAARLRRTRRQQQRRNRAFNQQVIAEVEGAREWLRRQKPEPSRSDEAQAADIAVLEQFDGFATLRNNVRRLANLTEEWTGIPIPIEGHALVVHPSYGFAGVLSEADKPEEDDPSIKFRNRFYSTRWRSDVVVYEKGGKIVWGYYPRANHLPFELGSLDVSDVWGIEQEANAVQLLGTLVRHRQFKQYMFTGMFCEQSKRSGLHYVFRKLRPTLVLSTATGDVKMIAALCMHPIGYYSGSWCGAMTPTDDVVAHLMLMRGDEHLYWRRCNQHQGHEPEAGI